LTLLRQGENTGTTTDLEMLNQNRLRSRGLKELLLALACEEEYQKVLFAEGLQTN
jgi:hypothetical protein